jgi:hypothetical protein
MKLELPKTAREVQMLDVLLTIHGTTCFNKGACDVSQSVQMGRFRNDGLLPCLSCTSRPYAICLGRFLTIRELYFLMGFPIDDPRYIQAMKRHALPDLMKLLGNSMCVPMVGYVGLAAMVACADSR